MASDVVTLWDINIRHLPESPERRTIDNHSQQTNADLRELGAIASERFGEDVPGCETSRGFLLEAELAAEEIERIAHRLLADTVIETVDVTQIDRREVPANTITVLPKPGVMDPVAQSARQAIATLGIAVESVRTYRRYLFPANASAKLLEFVAPRVLANEAIEQVVFGELSAEHLALGSSYTFERVVVPISTMDDAALERLSREGQLFLNLTEMRAIRDHFVEQNREPTDIELETIAQTWSEHCSHKTLRGPYTYEGEPGEGGLLKDTVFKVTKDLDLDWCVSVFEDNAGIIRFDDDWNICFKVETHNHPSAIEPYGGANTGLGGVIRDILGTGQGAKPICNTDVFCFASPDYAYEDLPDGVIHPARVMRGVVSGVRDYGNRMGIPTVNGAVCFDERYLGNPLVFCGTVGLLPKERSFKSPKPGDLIVALGGRTGRDGIHGATFSSGELHTESESVSGGAVQIGNAITQKKLMDVLLVARDRDLFHAVTDCGAGGFSSAVGEMGETIGAHVTLDSASLKYEGLSYTEIWISEAQERMVLAVPSDNWGELRELCESEDVEALVLGTFEEGGQLLLTYQGETVGELSMKFLHDGRPNIVHHGKSSRTPPAPLEVPSDVKPGKALHGILGSLNVRSKEWIIRQYDFEVQGSSVVKPLVGESEDGPSDAAVIAPVPGSTKGVAVGCGINPRLADADCYAMAASVIDEAIRNIVAVGGDPDRCALLDNFCWGNTERPEVFGTICEAAFACRDIAKGYGTPFISGKDSLHNEFQTPDGPIVIPPTLLISAMAIVHDVRHAVTMDLKKNGNNLILVGLTRDELGGSHFNLVTGATGGTAPTVDTTVGRSIFEAVHRAIGEGMVRSCHDLSEGGLAVAVAEMAFAGELGAAIDLADVPTSEKMDAMTILFSESNTRFLLEVPQEKTDRLLKLFGDLPIAVIGQVTEAKELSVRGAGGEVLRESIAQLKQSWQQPLK
ncbi:Phosphoribosylformylglycinamidine synthase subunit PurL [Planctomycetes bacterium Pan216]|uniref:Phosphoribosylformylglycinamidine synthase subunit PurL n=1 Tax=Kolteria novifilia TaxID=2527975 RepID=A0A518B5U5_9BACT|nr:Phosphoribosylformylglycinamidine synthase subunit PurL [Planctomycetes bacterium Pan216]